MVLLPEIAELYEQLRAEAEQVLTADVSAAKALTPEQEANRAKDELRGQVSTIALAGAAKILDREIDDKAHTDLLDELVSRI